MPEWASTHPDPASRVQRALGIANQAGTKSTFRNRDVFLDALNGVMYGDDPAQGVIEGSNFIHPNLKIAFSAPQGFGMSNGTDAVTIAGSSGKAQFTGASYSGDMDAYLRSVFNALASNGSLNTITLQRTTINGIPAAWATQRANTNSGAVDVTVFAYELGPKTAFHYVIMTQAGSGIGPFASMVQSFRRLNAQEAAAVKPRKVAVVTVKAGDTVASLSSRMAYADLKQERFLTMNALTASAKPTPGQRVKIVTY